MIIGLGETSFADFCSPEEGKKRRGRDGSRNVEDDNKQFKSKNLDAERKRRQKLSDRLLELRSLVPNITNAIIPELMNKATIITDAITYIEELQSAVRDLSDQLYEMDASLKEHLETQNQEKEINDNSEEMKKGGIEPEVQVTYLNGAKLWIHIVCQKKIGLFTKLMEALSVLGFELMDSSVTTSKGSLLVTLCVEATHCRLPEVDQIKDFLLETVTGI